ncbi:AraC family L-rhamnose operon transcriptional activator RhaR [Kribbella voronezhensis]|uniref:AraC family L-rhamnose operon transcriptional activator RhaR n=1 Tax=Kribbella voronezhensis TaxID=2512212 RepID=A0A4R7SUN4_9ACTN|nr:AraC family transcriptional regulator [Kribbella voronezhensis]TDU82256.1 AraC family L-rhamnose operon transcriptional activator RhaR [Kribbella voronezhensis]
MPETLHEAELFLGGPVWGGVHRLDVEVEAHAHDFLELAVVGTGTGRHQTSQGDRPVRRGQVIVLRPGAWHAFRKCSDLVVANCCISAQGLSTELSALQQIPVLRDLLWTAPIARGPHGLAVVQVAPEAADDAIEEIARLERELTHRPGSGRLLGRLVSVLGILADGLLEQPATQAVHPAVTAAVGHLQAALAEPWRLDDLAAAVNLDPAYLSRLFRRHTGLSPLGFLARLRAERAATLLVQTTLPAARVGAAVGWDDPTYFARRFRALVGSTPSEYRARTQRL